MSDDAVAAERVPPLLPPDAVLDVRGLKAGHGGVAVVRDVDLHVDPGEVVVLFGANGAGKSTILLTISGLLPVLGGTIDVLGTPVDHRRPHRNAALGVAHVAEDRALFTDLTVKENLRLGAPRGVSARDAMEQAAQWFPQLAELADRNAGLLSGGEQQMLAVARALVSHPRLLLVDEMSMGLAPILVEELLPILRRVADEQRTGVLLVEQHVHLALGIADRGVLLRHGEVAMSGPAGELAARPDLLAASYLGDH